MELTFAPLLLSQVLVEEKEYMAKNQSVDMSANTDVVKIVASHTEEGATAEEQTVEKVKTRQGRSKKYSAARAQVDKTRVYDAFSAIELVKKLSYSKFAGTITAHGIVRAIGDVATFAFPHSTGKTITAAIFSDAVEAEIAAGNITFDVLIARPSDMGKLTKFARTLGPKGLMPNPKNGTLTDRVEEKKKELEAGKIALKTEKKAPLFHIVIGKTDMDTKDLVANLQALIKAGNEKTTKLTIAASMSPGVKVSLVQAQ